MQLPIFITGNQHKADQLQRWLGLPVVHRKVDLDEIQSLDLRTVVEHKVRQAYSIVQQPVLVEDVAATINAMGRLPGTFIKWFLEEIGNEGVCRLADTLPSRAATITICYGLYDGKKIHFFEHSVEGALPDKPRGEAFGWNPIFVPKGATKTYAEMTPEEIEPVSMRAQAIAKLRHFLQTASA
jgi:non-canonical purine NTP pyrophosphatase (RdgB/HAM1 family)